MNELETKRHIEQSLARFSKGNLRENGIAFLNALGYRSGREVVLEPNTFDGLADIHAPIAQINREKALVADWVSVDILFQLTGDDIRELAQARFVFDGTTRVDNQIIESYLFIAIKLKQAEYSRSKFADITREINKFFAMPVMVLFQHGSSLTLSLINRRLNKREENKDVLEKVTLIKGINHAAPLRAHIEILFDLSLNQLQKDTRFHNFVDLHHAWQKALDTSELNKKFYREVANWYFWAVKKVEFPAGAGEDRETRNATSVIRLITRLIFVWFLKEKGLVPDDLFDGRRLKELLKFIDSKDSTYYKAILQNLFFATLNTEMGKDRRFRGKNKNPNGMDSHHGISTVYRYEDYFNDPAEALRLFANIPFLNGGLFECLDKREEKILVDGFSEDSRNQPVVPDELFFGKDRSVDLNDVYGDTRHSRENVRGLIHVFNSYKFTIEENTPLEEEIALDPELLGNVFENLLAAFNPETGTTARKQTGSFYTPREIVNYMVDEALIACLETKLTEALPQAGEAQARLRHLLAYNQEAPQFNEREKACLISAIDEIKVLDPACGSGAFPMGMLHKLVFILNKLDPENAKWKEKQIAKALEIPDPAVRERVVEDIEKSFNENELDYGRKLYLIENCIYGVDIQPIAVQIAKLRFFVSLVVDQKTDPARPNLGIRPLPNLETRFVAANTLIGIERPPQMMFRNPEIDEKEKRLAEVRDAMFTARTPATKQKYREQDQKLRGDIAALLKNDGWGSSTAAQLAGWDPYDQNTSAGFFDSEWMFGITIGFDVVIGNPPYVRPHKLTTEYKKFLWKNFSTFEKKSDLYVCFVEKSINILKNNGVLAFILSNGFLRLDSFEALRDFILRNTALKLIVDYEGYVFESAAVKTCILLLIKGPARKNIVEIAEINPENDLSSLILKQINQDKFLLTYKKIFDLSQDVKLDSIKEKMRHSSKSLGQLFDISFGLKTGDDSRFLSYECKSIDHKPLLRGENIGRYYYKFEGEYVWYVPDEMTTHRSTARPGNKERFEQPKILIRDTGGGLMGAYDENCYYVKDVLIISDDNKDSSKLKQLTGILNSLLLRFYYETSFPTLHVQRNELSSLPIRFLEDSAQRARIIELVEEIQNSKFEDHEISTSEYEFEIDRLVFELYGLTEQEIAIVEGQMINTKARMSDTTNVVGQADTIVNPVLQVTGSTAVGAAPESISVTTPTDYHLYKCSMCGQLLTGFMKDGHGQEKHPGKSIEWKKISGQSLDPTT